MSSQANYSLTGRLAATVTTDTVGSNGTKGLPFLSLPLHPCSALLPAPKNPEVKLQPVPPSFPTNSSPLSPPVSPTESPTVSSPTLSSDDEDPVSFERPAEATTLFNFNKSRARLSFKRRPPTRQHRRSAGEETVTSELHSSQWNGDKDQVFEASGQEVQRSQENFCEEPDPLTVAEGKVSTADKELEITSSSFLEATDETSLALQQSEELEEQALASQAQSEASGLMESIEEGHVGFYPAETIDGSIETEEQDQIFSMVD